MNNLGKGIGAVALASAVNIADGATTATGPEGVITESNGKVIATLSPRGDGHINGLDIQNLGSTTNTYKQGNYSVVETTRKVRINLKQHCITDNEIKKLQLNSKEIDSFCEGLITGVVNAPQQIPSLGSGGLLILLLALASGVYVFRSRFESKKAAALLAPIVLASGSLIPQESQATTSSTTTYTCEKIDAASMECSIITKISTYIPPINQAPQANNDTFLQLMVLQRY